MPSRRGEIAMSVTELARFLDEERVLTCATLGPNARPHLMPLWYVRDGLTLYAWTYGKSQKVRNLDRDPARVADVGARLIARYTGAEPSADAQERVRKDAAKRVVLRFTTTRIVSWDHRKLGGDY